MKRFFISDTHFCHKHIIEYTDRPFGSVEIMNKELIKRWNSVVGKNDLVYHLGDFGNWKWVDVEPIYKQLKGKILLIRGNHDHETIRRNIDWVPRASLKIGDYYCLLNHMAIYEWAEKKFSDSRKWYDKHITREDIHENYDFVLCGHSHNNWQINGRNINLSVENINYTPLEESILIKELRNISNEAR